MDPLPRLAVTTVLLHQRGEHLQVLLVRRPSTMVAFGDMWVFPGGQVDVADEGPAARAVIDTPGRMHAGLPFLAPDRACPDPPLLPLFTAACRELFEEVGVLFAGSADASGSCAVPHAALLERRADMLADAGRFYAELASHRLRLALGRLVPWSRWITPPARTRRFDTIFFVSTVDDPSVVPDTWEIAEACWLPLDTAIREGIEGTRSLMAPTVLTLMQIAAARRHYGSIAALLAHAPTSRLTPVQPRSLEVCGSRWIIFPWDAQAGEPGAYAWRTADIVGAVPGRIRADF